MASLLTLKNQDLTLTLDPMGAQLRSILDKNNREWLWQGDPDIWAGQAPLLFPFVGRLDHQRYTYQGATYPMTIHGFARTSLFQVVRHTQEELTFSLKDSPETLACYPFSFELQVTFRLEGAKIIKSHRVSNSGTTPMYYQLGGHDGYRLGFSPQDSQKDYRVELPQLTQFSPYNFDENAMLLPKTQVIPTDQGKIALNFADLGLDCFVLEDLPLSQANLLDPQGNCRISVEFPHFPYLVLWSPTCDVDTHLLCIEPWTSLPDCTFVGEDLTEKVGVRRLEGQAEEVLTFSTTFFL